MQFQIPLLIISSVLIIAINAIPLDVVYMGDSCDCPASLDYRVNIPRVYKSKKYTPNEYGYKIDVPPIKSKTKVSYSFDFTVEEPRTTRPIKNAKYHLYAKVDRVAVNKPDCLTSEDDEKTYVQYGESKPESYRYVLLQKPLPCQCQRTACNCKQQQLKQQSISPPPPPPPPPQQQRLQQYNQLQPQLTNSIDIINTNHIRRRRDLHRAFFPKQKLQLERPGRFVKQYRRNLKKDSQKLFDFENVGTVTKPKTKSKRKIKKTKSLFEGFQPKLLRLKRDIKGEYDLLEREREEMDLTLPDIIQYMPETLQSNFRRGQCNYGCQTTYTQQLENANDSNDDSDEMLTDDKNNVDTTATTMTTTTTTMKSINSIDRNINKNNDNNNNDNNNKNDNNNDNKLSSNASYKKRDAYNYERIKQPQQQLPQSPPSRPLPPPSLPVVRPPAQTNNDLLQYIVSTKSVPDPSAHNTLPLQFVGDLDGPPTSRAYNNDNIPLTRLSSVNKDSAVQHLSNSELDRIISDIVYRHPDFIDATSHYGGGLVDPEPMQRDQTVSFLKKLIEGRLRLWFGEPMDDQHFYQHQQPNPPYQPTIYPIEPNAPLLPILPQAPMSPRAPIIPNQFNDFKFLPY